jgi:hypothetical protein
VFHRVRHRIAHRDKLFHPRSPPAGHTHRGCDAKRRCWAHGGTRSGASPRGEQAESGVGGAGLRTSWMGARWNIRYRARTLLGGRGHVSPESIADSPVSIQRRPEPRLLVTPNAEILPLASRLGEACWAHDGTLCIPPDTPSGSSSFVPPGLVSGRQRFCRVHLLGKAFEVSTEAARQPLFSRSTVKSPLVPTEVG